MPLMMRITGDYFEVDFKDVVSAVKELQDVVDSGGGGGGEVTSEDISDATTVGKAVLTATDAAAARTATGAGTSNLTANQAVAAVAAKTQIAALTPIADPSTATVEDVATALNAIIAALKA